MCGWHKYAHTHTCTPSARFFQLHFILRAIAVKLFYFRFLIHRCCSSLTCTHINCYRTESSIYELCEWNTGHGWHSKYVHCTTNTLICITSFLQPYGSLFSSIACNTLAHDDGDDDDDDDNSYTTWKKQDKVLTNLSCSPKSQITLGAKTHYMYFTDNQFYKQNQPIFTICFGFDAIVIYLWFILCAEFLLSVLVNVHMGAVHTCKKFE